MASSTSMQVDKAMADPATERRDPPKALVLNIEFVKLFEGSKKLNNASFATEKHKISMRHLEREQKNMRGVTVIPNGPLCVMGDLGTTWRIYINKGTAHATAFADHFDALHPHPDALNIHLRNIHPLYIDRMLHMVYFHYYTMQLPHQIEFVDQDAMKEGGLLPNMTEKPNAELHFWMAMLADTVRYPDLKTFALGELQKALIADDILSASAFTDIISHLFDPEMRGVVDEDHSLRVIMATYGAFCDPVWRQQQPDVHESLTGDNGPDTYGYWHRTALAALPGASANAVPNKTSRLLQGENASASTMNAFGSAKHASGSAADASTSTDADLLIRSQRNIPTRARASAPKGVQPDLPIRSNLFGTSSRRQKKLETRFQRDTHDGALTFGQPRVHIGAAGSGSAPSQLFSDQTTSVAPTETSNVGFAFGSGQTFKSGPPYSFPFGPAQSNSDQTTSFTFGRRQSDSGQTKSAAETLFGSTGSTQTVQFGTLFGPAQSDSDQTTSVSPTKAQILFGSPLTFGSAQTVQFGTLFGPTQSNLSQTTSAAPNEELNASFRFGRRESDPDQTTSTARTEAGNTPFYFGPAP